jgi:thioredoxin-dependent peroxiredoxin
MTLFKSAKSARRLVLGLGGTVALLAGVLPAVAALPVGDKAPDFTLQAALGGKPLTFSLKQALRKGPVVLYFFPAAFTPGCTLEAHAFAEATDDFNKLHATVIGVTAGNIDRVAEFSSVECRNKFAVAADPDAKVAGEYKNQIQAMGKTLSDRTSYVIAPDGKILLSYTDRNPQEHITKALEAVKAWRAKHS